MSNLLSPRRYAIAVILFLSYAVFSISWMAISPLAPTLMEWFRVTKAEFALANTVVTISKVIAPVLAGAVALKIGIKNTILAGSVFIGFALAGPLYPSFSVFLVSRALFGVGGAVLVTLIPAMIMQWFPKNELAIVNGVNGVAANTGFALAMSLTVPLSTTTLGWRGTLICFALVSIVLAIAWALVGREGRDRVAAQPGVAAGNVGYRDVWKMKETWLIAMAFTGPVALYVSLTFWLPTYYVEQFGFDKLEAPQYTSIILYTGIPVAVVCGILTQMAGVRRPFLILGGALAGTAAFGTFLVNSPVVITVSAILTGIGLFTPTAALVTLLMELKGTTSRHVVLISGTMVSFCYLVVSFLPNLIGWISDEMGTFVPGFVLAVVLCWGAVLGGFLLPETGPKARRRAVDC